jgi:hypothetical protein
VCPATVALEEINRRRCQLDLAASREGNESVTLAWLEEALEHAYAHGQLRALAYLEAVMEDVVFVMKMAATRKAPTDG